ncbi:nucleotide pyrophosphohydrolase [Nakamurella deserti]|uniref:nucleotide pyrophosphohydrolase n=1 Tax=Nakamurella deserti TaxID=2164074 RepID=UPI000DBE1FFA|nr:nucleotide pyrophosphohydrolase [Nakamurella deserti]
MAAAPCSRAAAQVAEFHTAYELPLRTSATVEVGDAQVELRQALIEEEVAELAAAARAGDLVGVADALADIVYVAYGTAHVYGIDLDAVIDAVHTSNMTKLGADGRPVRRSDGKILKGPDYRPPEIAAVLHRLIDDIVTDDAASGAADTPPDAPRRA